MPTSARQNQGLAERRQRERVPERQVARPFWACWSGEAPGSALPFDHIPLWHSSKTGHNGVMKRAWILLPTVLGCVEGEALLDPLERIALEEMRWKGEAPTDPTNAVFDDPEAQSLGKDLFYDRRLSANGALSCGSCHQPELGFADGRVIAEGIGVAARHTQCGCLVHRVYFSCCI